MRWARKSNPALVEAVITSFNSSPTQARASLARFSLADWDRSGIWLKTSGLALYFLDRLCSAGITDAINPQILRSLQQSRTDNRVRVDAMLQEFIEINRVFQSVGISYANLKGFTLSPYSCPDLSLRHQSDFDFLVDPAHLLLARESLEQRGYEFVSAYAHTLEFKSGSSQTVSFDAHYRISPVRSVELHTAIEHFQPIGCRDLRLNRLQRWECDHGSFPALSAADQLIGQALHILNHLRNEHTRPSWLLEYRHHALARRHVRPYWEEIRALANGRMEISIAFGLSTKLASDLFGRFQIPELDAWVEALPQEVSLWADTFGRRAVLADVPGTKLYLFLDGVLPFTHQQQPHHTRISRLLPLHAPQRILRSPPHDTLALRTRRTLIQLRYVLYRLNFHCKQAILFAREAPRWNRSLKQAKLQPALKAAKSFVTSTLE